MYRELTKEQLIKRRENLIEKYIGDFKPQSYFKELESIEQELMKRDMKDTPMMHLDIHILGQKFPRTIYTSEIITGLEENDNLKYQIEFIKEIVSILVEKADNDNRQILLMELIKLNRFIKDKLTPLFVK